MCVRAMLSWRNSALSGTPSLVYFTYLGGALADSASAIAVDSSGDAYVTGSTASTDFPIVTVAPSSSLRTAAAMPTLLSPN